MEKFVTITVEQDGYKLILTQEYNEEFDCGHWRYVIMKGVDVIEVMQTTGGQARGKIDINKASSLLNETLRYIKIYGYAR